MEAPLKKVLIDSTIKPFWQFTKDLINLGMCCYIFNFASEKPIKILLNPRESISFAQFVGFGVAFYIR